MDQDSQGTPEPKWVIASEYASGFALCAAVDEYLDRGGDYISASNFLREGLQIWRGDVAISVRLSNILRAQRIMMPEMADVYIEEIGSLWEQARKESPDNYYVILWTGLVCFLNADFESALWHLQAACEFEFDSEPFVYRAWSLDNLGRVDEARESMSPANCPFAHTTEIVEVREALDLE